MSTTRTRMTMSPNGYATATTPPSVVMSARCKSGPRTTDHPRNATVKGRPGSTSRAVAHCRMHHQRRHDQRDSRQVSDVGPRGNRNRLMKHEVVTGPDRLGEGPGAARKGEEEPEEPQTTLVAARRPETE